MTTYQPADSKHADIWKPFTSDPTTGVSLLTIDGKLLYINDQATRVFFEAPSDPATLIGKSLSELGFPEKWVQERLDLFEQMHETGRSILLRTVWNGKQQFSWMSPIVSEDDCDQKEVLVITRRIPATEEAKYFIEGEHEVVKSNLIWLGELGVLTPRELEVLALLGQGKSIKEIAAYLFRSVKTIENHRESIGRKLKKTRGIDLACIAHVAGLSIDDSTRTRVLGEEVEEEEEE